MKFEVFWLAASLFLVAAMPSGVFDLVGSIRCSSRHWESRLLDGAWCQ